MITKIEIENFKCFGDRVEIPIRPITLLFGANSAGKSSIFQAIHYAREVLLNHNLDMRQAENAGDWIDLGGFSNFVHNRDLNRVIRLRFEFRSSDNIFSEEVEKLLNTIDIDFKLDDLTLNFCEAKGDYTLYVLQEEFVGIEIAIAWSQLINKPYVQECTIETSSEGDVFERLAKINYEPGKPEPQVTDINLDNNSLYIGIYAADDSEYVASFNLMEYLLGVIFKGRDFRAEPLPLSLLTLPEAVLRGKLMVSKDAWPMTGDKPSYDELVSMAAFSSFISVYFEQPLKSLTRYLEIMCYIGPFRKSPTRHHAYNSQAVNGDWSSGLAAWDLLCKHGNDLVCPDGEEAKPLIGYVSEWMTKLESGYQVELDQIIELSTSDPVYLILNNEGILDYNLDELSAMLGRLPKKKSIYLVDSTTKEKYLSNDVGQGISQILPIVVAVLRGKFQILLIEQPELHVHPKVQANLGDLFIYRNNMLHENQSPTLIETHSEHLILRLLRRIRETNNKTVEDGLSLRQQDIAVLYINSNENDESRKVYLIEIDDKGEFLIPWPDSFFEQDFVERFSS